MMPIEHDAAVHTQEAQEHNAQNVDELRRVLLVPEDCIFVVVLPCDLCVPARNLSAPYQQRVKARLQL